MKKVHAVKKLKIKEKEQWPFYLFISPWLLGFVGLTLFPMLYSLYVSFTDWDGISQPKFIGFSNFVTMFTADDKFFISLKNTLLYVLVSVPVFLCSALFLALMLKNKLKGNYLFRVLFYLPSVVAGVSTYLIWQWMFDANIGIINYLLSLVGVQGPRWLADPNWAMFSIIIMTTTFCGGVMLIFLAGLHNIPEQLYEAARIDGASKMQQFFKVTIPMLTPVVLLNVIMVLINSFQIFAEPWIMTKGGPVDATYVFGIHIYNSAFKYFKFGYASALSWVLFVIILMITLLVLGSARKWGHTEG